MTCIDLVYFDAGGGHRASAQALEAVIREQGRPWQVRLVNLFEVLDPQGYFRKLTGMRPEDLYNRRLERGWTLSFRQELKLLQAVIRLAHPQLVRRLQQHWLRTEPDMVVSVVPNFNRALYASLASALPGVPYVTILTDLADYPPHFWIERGQAQHFICGTPKAVAQAYAMGYGPGQVHATSGMILRPDFYRTLEIDRASERRKHGLEPELPTALVLFGGSGSAAMLGIAERLKDTQLILVCGHNEALATKLRALPAAAPRLVLGFTREIPYYMELADFFIGKPGPGSLSEAVQKNLPVIVERNAWTMPQERYNTVWVQEQQIGIVLRSFRSIRRAVAEMEQQLDAYRARVRPLENRAVFEIPDILAGILAQAQEPAQGPGHAGADASAPIGST
ncbi:MAG: galactosyldiacylglycerol synthase [Pseudomonadota bacterium]